MDEASALIKAKKRVEAAEDHLASVQEKRDKASREEVVLWDLCVLEAKERLCDERVKLAEVKLNLAEASVAHDASFDKRLRVSELKTAVATAEYEKFSIQLDLALKRCSVASEDDEKATWRDRAQHCKEVLRISAESLSFAHEQKKNTMKLMQEATSPTQVDVPTTDGSSKRRASQGVDTGVLKMPRTEKLSADRCSSAWQWRHSDGTWMDFSESDSALIDEARNRRDSTCSITFGGLEFLIDLEKMEQRRADAGGEASGSNGAPAPDVTRPIRRWQEEWNEDSMLRWNAVIREVYPSWNYQTSEVQVCDVKPGTNDFHKVERMLFDGSGRLAKETHEICRVVRVQNVCTLSRYENEKSAISRKRNGGEHDPGFPLHSRMF